VAQDRGSVERRRARDHDLELDRIESRLQRLLRALARLLRAKRVVDRLHLAAAEVVVEPDLLANIAAQQLPDRSPERLPEDVPAGLLDARDRRALDHSRAEEVLAHHHLEQVLDAPRILADEKRREILDAADDRARLPLDGRLAPTNEPLVGLELDEHPVAHLGTDDNCRDARDPHRYRSQASIAATILNVQG
jgi:hypothetical protein